MAKKINLCVFLLVFSIVSGAKVLSSAVAVTGREVITSRGVQISSIVEHWLLQRLSSAKSKAAGAPRADWLVSEGSTSFSNEVSYVLVDCMVSAEAESLSLARVNDEDLDSKVRALQSELKDWPEWQRLEVSRVELTAVMSRHLRAAEYLKLKTAAMGFSVSDEEAKQYFDANKSRFNGMPFVEFKESIKEFLVRRQVETKLKDWIELLRRKYRVRSLLPETPKA